MILVNWLLNIRRRDSMVTWSQTLRPELKVQGFSHNLPAYYGFYFASSLPTDQRSNTSPLAKVCNKMATVWKIYI